MIIPRHHSTGLTAALGVTTLYYTILDILSISVAPHFSDTPLVHSQMTLLVHLFQPIIDINAFPKMLL